MILATQHYFKWSGLNCTATWMRRKTNWTEQNISALEQVLYQARHIAGKCNQIKRKFRNSDLLTHLRQQRRLAACSELKSSKLLHFNDTKCVLRSSELQTLLQHAGILETMRQLQTVAHQRTTEQPPPNDGGKKFSVGTLVHQHSPS